MVKLFIDTVNKKRNVATLCSHLFYIKNKNKWRNKKVFDKLNVLVYNKREVRDNKYLERKM